MITSGQQTITTTRSRVDGTAAAPCTLIIHNSGNNKVVLGNEAVTASSGFELHSNSTIQIALPAGDTIHAIAATGSHDISWIRFVQ
jgi:hypothetical protein